MCTFPLLPFNLIFAKKFYNRLYVFPMYVLSSNGIQKLEINHETLQNTGVYNLRNKINVRLLFGILYLLD